MNFQPGDRVRSKSTKEIGKIVSISYNSIERDNEYYIEWDSVPGQQIPYLGDMINGVLEKHSDNLPFGFGSVAEAMIEFIRSSDAAGITQGSSQPQISTPKGCDHKWKSYQGLIETFDYCEKCDEKRKQ